MSNEEKRVAEAANRGLADILDAMPERVGEIVRIDVSEQLGESAGTTVFTYREPTAAQLFQAGESGKKLAALHPEMTEAMGSMIATIALAHVSPSAPAPALLYARLALKNGRLYMWLLGQFLAAFPHLQNLEAETKAAKKSFGLE